MKFRNWSFVLSAAAMSLALLQPVAAQDLEVPANIDTPASAPEECKGVLNSTVNDFVGWRRNFWNGYGDSFELHGYPDEPTVLVISTSIDDTAYEVDTSCYDAAGTLTFISTAMHSTDQSTDPVTALTRIGEITVDAAGKPTKTIGWIQSEPLDGGKPVIYPLNDETHALTRGCRTVAIYKTAADVQTALDAVLGDIEGNHPVSKPVDYDWCTAAKAP